MTHISYTKHPHSSQKCQCCVFFVHESFSLRVKRSHVRIFLDKEKIRSQHLTSQIILLKCTKTHSSLWQESTHTSKEIKTHSMSWFTAGHVFQYQMRSFKINHHDIKPAFFRWAVKKRTFTHFQSLLFHDVHHSTAAKKHNSQEKSCTKFPLQSQLNFGTVIIVYLKVLVQVQSGGPDNSAGSRFNHGLIQVRLRRFSLGWTANTQMVFWSKATETTANDRTAPPCGYNGQQKRSETAAKRASRLLPFVSNSSH